MNLNYSSNTLFNERKLKRTLIRVMYCKNYGNIMMQRVKNAIRLMLKKFDIAITSYSAHVELQSALQEFQGSSSSQDIEVLLRLPEQTAL